VGDIFLASDDVVSDAMKGAGIDIVDSLITMDKNDIDRNKFGLYRKPT
jgi:hypothetical protein